MSTQPTRAERRRRGDFPTPPDLVARVVDAVLPPIAAGQRVSVFDPACGDGRFLVAAAERICAAGGRPDVVGIDLEARHVDAARRGLGELARRLDGVDWRIEHGDALAEDWPGAGTDIFDMVVGNPPYLSQLAAATTRGAASRRGGGPYADVAAEFLLLAVQRARAGGGRVGLVLPQSILASRDAGPLRAAVDADARRIWSWWSLRKVFDANVFVCAIGFERGNFPGRSADPAPVWTDVITRALGVPDLPEVHTSGTLGGQIELTADFRDQYYGLVPAVGDHEDGPRLVTSGLIDPNRCHWGERPITFNRRPFGRPRVDLSRLSDRMRTWADRRSCAKVLIANQSKVIECIVDTDGTTLPGVPVITARRREDLFGVGDLTAAAAVLSSPWASVWTWHRAAGTGLSAQTIRLRPAVLAGLPWPAGSLAGAVAAWRDDDLPACASAVHAAYGLDESTCAELTAWWEALRP